MDFITNIKLAANSLIFGKSKKKKQIDAYDCAQHVNRSYNYLWKIADINSEHPIPLEIIVPLMKLKNDDTIVNLICWEMGGVFVKIPKYDSSKKTDVKVAADFQAAAGDASASLARVFEKPTEANIQYCLNALKLCAGEAFKSHKYVEKKTSKQISMEL